MKTNADSHSTTICFAVFLLAAGLLAVPGSGADASDDLSVEAVEVHGHNALQGELALLLQEQEKIDQGSVMGRPDFRLDADQVRIETDRSDLTLGSGFGPRLLVDTMVTEYESALIQGLEHREDYQFSIWPLESGASILAEDGACADVLPSENERVERPPLVRQSRESDHVVVEDSLMWSGCDRRTNVTIQGDFLLRLWEWDAELTADGETRMLQSGSRNGENLPEDAPDLRIAASQADEQFIYAYNATLTIPRLEGHYELYLEGGEAMATGGFTLAGSTGTLLGISIDQQEVFVSGDDLAVRLAGTGLGQSLSVAVAGAIDRFEVDGEPMGTLAPSEAPPAPLHFLGIAALIAAGLVALAGTGVWHTSPAVRNRVRAARIRRQELRFDELLCEANDFHMDRPRRQRKWAKKALRLRPNHPEALVAMGQALKAQRRYEAALPYYQKAIHAMYTHKPREMETDIVAFWARDAAQCLARMRFGVTDPTEREELSEQILEYARLAWKEDRGVAKLLLDDGTLSDLWGPLQVLFDMGQHGVHA